MPDPTMPGPGLSVGDHSVGAWTLRAAPRSRGVIGLAWLWAGQSQEGEAAFFVVMLGSEACCSHDILDWCLSDGPEARGVVFQSLVGGLHLDMGRSAGGPDFLLKAIATHRRVCKQESYLVILEGIQKKCEIKSKIETSEDAGTISQVRE